jgi:dynein heavy chain
MASETKDDNISKFSTELDKSLADLMSEVAEIHHQSQDPLVLNPSASSEVALKFLDALDVQIKKAEMLKKRYEDWAELFKAGGSRRELDSRKKGGEDEYYCFHLFHLS